MAFEQKPLLEETHSLTDWVLEIPTSSINSNFAMKDSVLVYSKENVETDQDTGAPIVTSQLNSVAACLPEQRYVISDSTQSCQACPYLRLSQGW